MAASPAFAENSMSLQWPLACSVGRDCFIAAYPDVTAGTDPTKPVDHRCGNRTLPGLAETQIVFKDWNAGLADQAVYPVAVGKVTQVVADFVDGDMQTVNHACGNLVMVDHGGWESTYCHLRQNSVAVKAGQSVSGQDVLGLVGQSGTVVEPMLALQITRDGQAYDPFLSQAIHKAVPCNKQAAKGDWAEDIHYLDATIISDGFAPRVVNHLEVKANAQLSARDLTSHSPYLVGWARVQHVMAGDEESFTLMSPTGQKVEERVQKLPGASEDYLSFVFVKAGKEGLAAGDWSSHYQLKRSGRIILQKNNSIHLE